MAEKLRRRDKYSNEVEEKARSADYVEPIKKPLSIPFVASSKGTPHPDPHSMPLPPRLTNEKFYSSGEDVRETNVSKGGPAVSGKLILQKDYPARQ